MLSVDRMVVIVAAVRQVRLRRVNPRLAAAVLLRRQCAMISVSRQ